MDDYNMNRSPSCDWAAMERELCSAAAAQPTCPTPDEPCTPSRRKTVHLDPEFGYRRRTPSPPKPPEEPKLIFKKVSYKSKRRSITEPPPEDDSMYLKRGSSIKPDDVILMRSDETFGENENEELAQAEERKFKAWMNEEFGEFDEEEEYGGEYGDEADEEDEEQEEEEQEIQPEEPVEIASPPRPECKGLEEDTRLDGAIFTEAELRFLIKEHPPEDWNSTFCLKRLKYALKHYAEAIEGNPTLPWNPKIETRCLILWKFYHRRSHNGILIPDVKLLMDNLQVLEETFRTREFAKKLIGDIEAHYCKGLKVQQMTEKFSIAALHKLFDKMARNLSEKTMSIQVKRHTLSIFTKLTKVAIESKRSPAKVEITPDGFICNPTLSAHEYFVVLENSDLPKAFVKKLLDRRGAKYHDKLVKIIRLITDRSVKLCRVASGYPILNKILRRLDTRGKPRNLKTLCHTIKIIFNLYANPKVKLKKPAFTCRLSAFRNLLGVFLERSRMITSKYMVSLRNDVTFAVLLLIRNIPELRGGFELYANLIASIVSTNIFGDVPHYHIVLDATTDDFEYLKTLVWILKYVLEEDIEALKYITQYSLMSAFMSLLLGPCDIVDKHLELGELSEMDSMLNITWHCLSTIARRFPQCFKNPEAIDAILSTLDIYATHGITELSIVGLFLDLCRILLTPKEKKMCEYFDTRAGMAIFAATLKQLTKTDWPMSDEPIISKALMCCSLMSDYNDKQRQIFFENNGVKVLLRLLNRLVYAPPHKRHMNAVIHISLADCIWQCLCDAPTSLECFLMYEGVFRMLELLEIAAGPGAQLHILSCILELIEYPRCIDQLLFWKRRVRDDIQRLTHGQDFNQAGSSIAAVQEVESGDRLGEVLRDQDMTLAALLCEIWREEEDRLGVKRDKDGVIASIEHPLMSVFARSYEGIWYQRDHGRLGHQTEGNKNGPASLDMVNSVRPKIYLLVKKITEEANTEASVYGGLSVKNQVTMQTIINMLDLKRGEIWLEVVEGLRRDEINLVETDRKGIDLYKKISENKVSVVIDTQRYLIRRAKEDAELKEQQFYEAIKTCHLQDHLRAIKEAEYFARTSNYFLLIDKRLWQKAQIQRAVINIESNARLHRTTDDTLNITTWTASRTKFIESEPRFSNVGFDEEQSKREAEKYVGPMTPPEIIDDGMGGTITKRHEYRFTSRTTVTHHPGILPTHMRSPADTPEPDEDQDRFFEIDPSALQRALLDYLMELRKWNWKTASKDPETAWSVRTKWKADWYH